MSGTNWIDSAKGKRIINNITLEKVIMINPYNISPSIRIKLKQNSQ